MPRIIVNRDEYTLSKSREDLKELLKSYYGNYTKEEAERIRKLYYTQCDSMSDYSLTDGNALLLKKFKPIGKCSNIKKKPPLKHASFIHLTPSELHNIKVIPTNVHLESVSIRTLFDFLSTIKLPQRLTR